MEVLSAGMLKRGMKVYLSYVTETLIPKEKRPCDVEINVSLVLFEPAEYKYVKVQINKSRSPFDPNNDSTE